MHDLIPLHVLSRGQTAQVGQLMGMPEQVRHLEELGLRQGATVEMVEPGTPCIIRLAGSKLCFRQCDLLSVLVRPGAVA
jgi:Fe2+ transport system protein FeoA